MATTLADTLMFSIEQLDGVDGGLLRAVDSDHEEPVTFSIEEAEELVEKVPAVFGSDESPVVVGGVMAVPDKDADPWFHLVPSSVSYPDVKRIEGALHNDVGDMDLDHGYSSMSQMGLRKALQRAEQSKEKKGLRKALQRAEQSKESLEERVREAFDGAPDIETGDVGTFVTVKRHRLTPWIAEALAERGVVVSSVRDGEVSLRDVDDLGLEVSE